MGRIAMIACATAWAIYALPGHAGSIRHNVIRYGYTSGWFYDNRDDDRDFPSNGVFPGNFAAQPSIAWIGAGGIAGTTPRRSATPYPSQVVFGTIGPHQQPHRRKWRRHVTSSSPTR